MFAAAPLQASRPDLTADAFVGVSDLSFTAEPWIFGEIGEFIGDSRTATCSLVSSVLAGGGHALANEGGGFVAQRLGAGCYLIAALLMEGNFPRRAMVAQMALRMFVETDAMVLVNRDAVRGEFYQTLRDAAGFKPTFRVATDSFCGEVQRLSIEEWILDSKAAADVGRRLMLDIAGSAHSGTDFDRAKAAHLGASVLMGMHGQSTKGLHYYNIFALCSGYDPIVASGDAQPYWVIDGKPVILSSSGPVVCR